MLYNLEDDPSIDQAESLSTCVWSQEETRGIIARLKLHNVERCCALLLG
jgi:hypothetical protein